MEHQQVLDPLRLMHQAATAVMAIRMALATTATTAAQVSVAACQNSISHNPI